MEIYSGRGKTQVKNGGGPVKFFCK